MRILLMGIACLAEALRELGHEVLSAGCGQSQIALGHPLYTGRLWQKLAEADFEPDLLVYMDDGNLPVLLNPECVPCPAIYFSIDAYCNPWHVCYAHGFDMTLVAQKDFVPIFAKDGQNAVWFPLFNPINQSAANVFRDIPVAFVGSMGHKNNSGRKPFLQRFRKLQPLVMMSGNYAPVFQRSRIVLNQTAFSEINFRCFEAMACGAALLMEKCGNGMDELFSPGENILPPYPRNDAQAAAAIAREYLAKPRLLAEVAEAGRDLVTARHGARNRAEELLRLYDGIRDGAGNRKELAAARQPFVRAAFAMIGAELTQPELAGHRKFYLELGGARL